MSKKLKREDIKPGLIIINNAISINYQYIERIDEVIDDTLIKITASCRNFTTTDNEFWYSMSTFYQTLDYSDNHRLARINEIWYFNLNIIEEGQSPYE